MYGCESWTIKRAECWRIEAFELWYWRRFLSLLDKIKPTNPKGNQPWTFTGRTDTEAEASILWPPDTKSWLISKDSDAGNDWQQEEKGTTEDKMVGWHHQLNGYEFTWVWASSGHWLRTGRPGVLQSMGSQNRTQLSNWTTTPSTTFISALARSPEHFGSCSFFPTLAPSTF